MTSTEIQREIESNKAQLAGVAADLKNALNDPKRYLALEGKRHGLQSLLEQLESALGAAQAREEAERLVAEKEAARAVLEESKAEAGTVAQKIAEQIAGAARYLEARLEVIEPLRMKLGELHNQHVAAHALVYGPNSRPDRRLIGDANDLLPYPAKPAQQPKSYPHAILALTTLLHDIQGGPFGLEMVRTALFASAVPPQHVPTAALESVESEAPETSESESKGIGAEIARLHGQT